MMILARIHDGVPVLFADLIRWITSTKRRSRRIKVYTLAQKSQLYPEQVRVMLEPFEAAGLIKYVGGGLRRLNKIEVKDSLEAFWRNWALPSLEPWSLDTDFKRVSKRSLTSLFQSQSLKPFVKRLSRKPKELVIWSLFRDIFKSQDSFESYRRNCLDSLNLEQMTLYNALSGPGLTLAEAACVFGENEKLLSNTVESLCEKWLIRLIWQNENGVLHWRIMRFQYEQMKREIQCFHDNASFSDDVSFKKMLSFYKCIYNKKFENKRIWEHYFERVDCEWLALNVSAVNTFRHFMEWWYCLIGKGTIDKLDIKSGIYNNGLGQVCLLLIQESFEKHLQHAIRWGLIDKKKSGFQLTVLGNFHISTLLDGANGIKTVWARNRDWLTIILDSNMDYLFHDWLDRVAQKIETGRYLISPNVLHSKEINFNEVLCIVGSITPLLPRQVKRLALWIKR